MSSSRRGNLDKSGKKKAKIAEVEDGPLSFGAPRSPRYLCDVMENKFDGGIEDFEVSAWKEKGGGEEEAELDPLVVFGSGIMLMILSTLDARSVALARLVSRDWHRVASSDEIWLPKDPFHMFTNGILNGDTIQTYLLLFCMEDYKFTVLGEEYLAKHKEEKASCRFYWRDGSILVSQVCEELWLGKAHIPRISKVQGLPKLAAYSLSVMDFKRTRITWNDLCDHVWEFHFTEAAPDYWRNLDPHWQGSGTRMRRYFHRDGSITADPDDRVWGGHESCYTVVTGLLEDGTMREHYVRINRWPQLSVQREEDGGWKLANHLYCYTSVPDADKVDGTGPPFPLFS